MLDHLPIEIRLHILKKLPSSSIIRCREVCKKLKQLVDNYIRIKSDLIISFAQRPYEEKWFDSNETLDLNFLVESKNLNFLQNDSVKLIFGKIKRLYIFDFPEQHTNFDLQILNHYQELEHLELWYLKLKMNSKLSLPNLKSFCIKETTNSRIIINSRISKFETIFKANLFDYTYPESLKMIVTYKYKPILKTFLNLEILYCQTINSLDDDFLIRLPYLNRIQFYDLDTVYYELRRKKRQMNRRNLEIYFMGINFEKRIDNFNSNGLLNYDLNFNRYYLNNKNIDMYINNYEYLDDKVWFINSIDYDTIQTHFKSFKELPSNFFHKFPSINSISANSEILDEESFYLFLKNCKPISKLKLENTGLNNLEKLSLICNSLIELTISESLKSFDFIFNFKNLIGLDIDQEIPLDYIKRMFNDLKSLEYLSFKIDSCEVCIDNHQRGNNFELEFSDYLTPFLGTIKNNIEDLIDFIKNKNYEDIPEY